MKNVKIPRSLPSPLATSVARWLLFSHQKSQFWVNFGGPYIDWKMLIYFAYGHLERFTGFWDTL
jgi:hypothetical protein